MSRRERRSRASLVNGGAAAIVMAIIAVVALNAATTPPPAIAELSPQPQKQITEAPQEQSSQFGKGDGGGECADDTCAAAEETTTTTTLALKPVIERARVRRCVGNPPRQTEDPQSPPCVPYWQGDNGGATWKGVTGDEIRIAVPDGGEEDALLAAYFNNRFEFYGRKLVLLNARDDHGSTPEEARAAAVIADEQRKVFASTDLTYRSKQHYVEELARRQIMIGMVDANASEAFMASRHPFVWQYTVGIEHIQTTLGRWACARLAGRPPRTGGPIGGGNRVFGIMVQDETVDRPVDLQPLQAALSACGARAVHEERVTVGDLNGASNAVLRMKAEGVTSVFCLCVHNDAFAIMTAANAQAWEPEWLLSSYGRMDRNFSYHLFPYPSSQLENAIGLTFVPRQIKPGSEPMRWAQSEMGQTADTSDTDLAVWNVNVKYRSLLLLASGIQMAGPRLTPETFAAGLHKARFPNPDHPNIPGKVDFSTGDHTMTQDYAEWWWSPRDSSPYSEEGQGTVCYVANGLRHPVLEAPTTPDRFFEAPCHNGRE